MNTEIFKIRAYHIDRKIMLAPKQISNIRADRGRMTVSSDQLKGEFLFSKFIIMLPVPSVKDKNGVQLFERDIIKFKDTKGEVRFNKILGFYVYVEKDDKYLFLPEEEFEIVGNSVEE